MALERERATSMTSGYQSIRQGSAITIKWPYVSQNFGVRYLREQII